MLNNQPIEKRVTSGEGVLLDVHSIFYTIQGEGPFAGTPAVFIRLAGCNLQCPWCDTEYTEGRKSLHCILIMDQVRWLMPHGAGLVVITGGEPFRQNLSRLLEVLELAGNYVQIETNGTLPPPIWEFNTNTSERAGSYIVCSPKTGKVNPKVWNTACCVKYVMEADAVAEDGLPLTALGHTANPRLARPPADWDHPIYLQPMDAKDIAENNRNVQAVKSSCLDHGYIIQLQIHKIIGVE